MKRSILYLSKILLILINYFELINFIKLAREFLLS